jgi:holo-[acyl-carrier protein] synthase
MNLRTGIDIIEIPRIREVIARRGAPFLNRIFTPNEQRYCNSLTVDPATRYAGRFAAKEAIVKALGSGIGAQVGWLDVEIICRDNGEPAVFLSERVRERYDQPRISVSISHCREYATAIAIWIG